ncbi:proactivator polypeptide-like 1 [Chenopodium quinoa]|uniref:Saposin B-type domain-containing protein n=1 Tax=Chenopodium quinoa TaxID=63459 RepID=A0A803L3B5_CHEQI|nr:proactivator polypeptide-like 1 [Chenopodium quinoa]
MDVRVGLVVLLVLAGNLVCDSRSLAASDVSGLEIAGPIDVCTMCEEYTTLALDYLNQNKTHNEIMESLHKACLQMHGLVKQCTLLVNYYAPLFFLEVSSVEPEGFCKKIDLCRNVVVSIPEKRNKCDLCHRAVDEALDKLKDPDTELEVIQILLKACNAVGRYTKKCKSMVFEFGPLILVDAQKFIANVDLCSTFHACSKHNNADTERETVEGKIEMVTSS